MSVDPHPHEYRGHAAGPAPVAQWVGVLLAPLTFFVHLQAGYLLVIWSCDFDKGRLWVHLAAGLAVGVALVGLWAAYSTWVRAGALEPGEGGGPVPRTRLLGGIGVGLSAIFALLLLSQLVAGFIVPMCQ